MKNDRKKRARSLRSWGLEPGPDVCRLGSEMKPEKKQLLVILNCSLEAKVLVHSRVGEKGGVGEQGLASLEHYRKHVLSDPG